jgi:hypothetical protein
LMINQKAPNSLNSAGPARLLCLIPFISLIFFKLYSLGI